LATGFYPNIRKLKKVTNKYWTWPQTYLNYSIDIRFTNIRRQYISRLTSSLKKDSIHISFRFYMHLQAAILFAQEIGKFFSLTTENLLNPICQLWHNIKVFKYQRWILEWCSFYVYPLKKSQISWHCPFKYCIFPHSFQIAKIFEF
jgi:hypothetical protein